MTRLLDDEAPVQKATADFSKLLSELCHHLDAGDARGFQRYARKVEGLAANIGGEEIRALASGMEEAGKVGALGLVAAGADALGHGV